MSRRRPLRQGRHDCHNNLRCRGIFFRQSFQRPVKIGSVTDGTSHTFMIGENLPDYDNHSTAFYGNGDWCSCNIPLNNLLNVDPATLNLSFWGDQQGFRSRHPGGAQFCLVDGSVRFVAENVDNQTYRVACTRNGNEPLLGSVSGWDFRYAGVLAGSSPRSISSSAIDLHACCSLS